MKKILISSDCHGNFDKLFSKVNQLHSKNKFDLMLMLGNVCSSSTVEQIAKIRSKQIQVKIPTYFINNSDMTSVLNEVYPEGGQISENFVYLGKKGIKMIEGLKVCYVSGIDYEKNCEKLWNKLYGEDNKDQQDKTQKMKEKFNRKIQQFEYQGQYFTQKDTDKLITENSLTSIDILLTNQWPTEFEHPNFIQNLKSDLASQLCYELSPKYHIAAGGKNYYRMNPFRNKKGHFTHFMNVAEIPPSADELPKDKYLVAIQIDTVNPAKQPKDIEQNRFSQKTKNAKNRLRQQQLNNQICSPQALKRQQQIIHTNQNRLNEIIERNKNKAQQSSKSQELSPNDYIHFEGFPLQTTDRQISEFLQRWGSIKSLSIQRKQSSKFSRSGICRFVSLQDARICLQDSNRYTLYQNRIKFNIKKQNEKYRVSDCFLCVGNANFDDSLIVYVGKFCFISVDKGPIQRLHYQIVPINHVGSTRELEIEEKQEINEIQKMLINSFKERKLTTISYQRYANLSYEINHCIINIIAVDIEQSIALQRFRSKNISHQYRFQQSKNMPPIGTNPQQQISQHYIKLSINNRQFLKILTKKDRDLQLGRQVVCQILEKPQKLNWRDCQRNPQEVRESVEYLRKIMRGLE